MKIFFLTAGWDGKTNPAPSLDGEGGEAGWGDHAVVKHFHYPESFKAIYITPSQPSPSREGVYDVSYPSDGRGARFG